MKLLTTLSVATLLAVAGSAATAHERGKLVVMNDSRDATAVGGEIISENFSANWFSASGSYLSMAGERANAGSVVVNGCPCRKKTVIHNKSRGALAIGGANAGSVVINAGLDL